MFDMSTQRYLFLRRHSIEERSNFILVFQPQVIMHIQSMEYWIKSLEKNKIDSRIEEIGRDILVCRSRLLKIKKKLDDITGEIYELRDQSEAENIVDNLTEEFLTWRDLKRDFSKYFATQESIWMDVRVTAESKH